MTPPSVKPQGAKQATPRAQLLAELMDPCVPKNEREWAAAERIAALERDLHNTREAVKAAAALNEREAKRLVHERDALKQQLADALRDAERYCAHDANRKGRWN